MLDIVSWLCMSLEDFIAEEKGAHPDHSEKKSHGSDDRFCWGVARGLLHDIEDPDSYPQCGETAAPALWLLVLGVVCHGRIAR